MTPVAGVLNNWSITVNYLAPGGTVAWTSNPAGFTSTMENPMNVSSNNAGVNTYTVVATSGNGCTASATTSVNVSQVTATLSTSGIITCANPTRVLTATGGTQYNFGSGFSATATSNVTTAGVYTVTVQNADGCTATSTVAVTSNTTAPTATATSANNLTCTTTSSVLTATGGGTYVWSGGSNIASAAGTYTVTVTSATNGCTATSTVAVTSNTTAPTATATSANNLTCTTTSSILTATGGGSYAWSGGGTNATKTVTAAGTYTVTVTSATNGCTATSTVAVTSNTTAPTATAVTTTNTACAAPFTGSVTLTTTGTLFNWSNAATTQNLAQVQAGTYTVTVTAANGCSTTTAATVTDALNIPTVSVSSMPMTPCTMLMATGGSSYIWSNAATTANVTVSNGTYTVTATGTNGCTTTATQTASAAPITITQNGSTLTATTGASSYQWFFNGAIIAGATSATYTPMETGSYTVQATSTDGCSVTSDAFAFTFVSTNNMVEGSDVKLYPNPTTGIVTLEFANAIRNTQQVAVRNAVGQIIYTNTIVPTTLQKTIDLSGLSAGVYFVSLQDAQTGSISTMRVLIQK